MKSKVYFIKSSLEDGAALISTKARKLFQAGQFASCFNTNDFTAVKVHVGEAKNTTYIKAPCLKGLVDELKTLNVKPFLTDTSTLYTGRRHNAVDHATLAAEHGFDVHGLGIPFIAPDGLFGNTETPISINGEIHKNVLIASDIAMCQSLLSIAHLTGHCATCAAATLKTLGMGCASRKGKMRQHSALKPSISDKCTNCGTCVARCSENAITIDNAKAKIDQSKCVGCAECFAVCRFDAVQYDWGAQNEKLQKSIAEHALGAIKGKESHSVFFNFGLSITRDCDCFSQKDMPLIVNDIGIFASTDPVAVDAAAIETVHKQSKKTFSQLLDNQNLDHRQQLIHAEKIGLGRMDYDLIEIIL